ncbi:MAG TPA: UDP-N-acetylmuramoyl-L-alanyl-D-glutamate--2,6-diaminopimelate ligase [Clostridiales bacterium]|nr:UDP-N-acetylmuramoyl-L-alanyl-D-glutamate--2,6-diaminopimelate ligase [Clostridiales bacterium]
MELRLLCSRAGINCPAYEGSIEITGIVSDSRQVCPGYLYVCIRGLHYDGHDFIRQALGAGASAIVAEEGAPLGCVNDAFIITVPGTRQSLACLLDAWYGFPSRKMKFVAVTGTNGKTSVTFMLKAIFEAAMFRCGLIGTVSCLSANRRLFCGNRDKFANLTTPDPEQLYMLLAEMAADNVEYVFIEATSHALWLDKLSALWFDAAIFTNLTPEHLDFHGSMENYLRSKQKLFRQSALAVINADSEYYNDIAEACVGRVVSCSATGVGAGCDYTATEITDNGTEGMSYILRSERAVFRLKTQIPGKFSVINTLQAAACAAELGIKPKTIADAIAGLNGIDGRLEKVKLGYEADFSVFIDYAHTPDALENLLLSVRGFRKPGQRVVLLFGCGGDRDKGKRPVMGEIATRLADFAVITSDNSRSEDPEDIIRDILAGVGDRNNYTVVVDRRKAIENTVVNAKKGDIIILAGKGHETYEINRAGRFPFNEKEIAQAAARQRFNG